MDKRMTDLRSSFSRGLYRQRKQNDQPAPALARQVLTTGHEYKPLPQAGDYIRLLQPKKTWRAKGPKMLHFDFIETKLQNQKDSTIAYYAISYTWGESPGLAPIVLDGQQVLIPASAEAALRGIVAQLGFPRRHALRPIWVDAVCIDQANMHEKQQQIGIMGRIYSLAKMVFVWLGPDDGTAKRAFKSLKLLAQQQEEFDAVNMEKRIRELHRTPSGVDVASLDSFLGCPWFTRLWTLQEVALSQHTIFVWGLIAFDWHIFERSIDRIVDDTPTFDDINTLSPAKIMPVLLLTSVRTNMQNGTQDEPVLVCALSHATREPWDKVYGLLGLIQYGVNVSTQGPPNVRTGSLRQVTPDYSRPLVDVFRDATWLTLRGEEDSLFLLWSGQTMVPLPEAYLLTWPSWVPRYHESKGFPLAAWSTGDDASNGVEAHYRLDAGDETVLNVQGVHVQIVRAERVQDMTQIDAVEQFLAGLWDTPREWGTQELSHVLALFLFEPDEHALSDFGAYLLACKARTLARCTGLAQAIREIRGEKGHAHRFREALRQFITDALNDMQSLSLLELSDFRFAKTTLGLVKPGDHICILFGMMTPVVLRPWGEHYKLRGLAVVPGIENGEHVQRLQDEGRLEEETVTFSIC